MPLPGDEPMESAVYDAPVIAPQAVQPSAPPPAPEPEGTSGHDGSPGEGAQEPLPEFDPRHQEDFQGLLYLGALTDTFTWLGHTFTIRTLTTGELAEAALVIKEFAGTLAMDKAYQTAVVAAAIQSVDGQPLPAPITNDPLDTPVRNRFNYVHKQWFPPVIDAVYERYYRLELRVREVIGAMGNRSG